MDGYKIVALILCATAACAMPRTYAASQSRRAHIATRHHFHALYAARDQYVWHWVIIPTTVGAPTGGAPLYYFGGGYLPGYGAAYPYYSGGYAPGYGCSTDYHYENGYCYPN
jgi:hypothetical protein